MDNIALKIEKCRSLKKKKKIIKNIPKHNYSPSLFTAIAILLYLALPRKKSHVRKNRFPELKAKRGYPPLPRPIDMHLRGGGWSRKVTRRTERQTK